MAISNTTRKNIIVVKSKLDFSVLPLRAFTTLTVIKPTPATIIAAAKTHVTTKATLVKLLKTIIPTNVHIGVKSTSPIHRETIGQTILAFDCFIPCFLFVKYKIKSAIPATKNGIDADDIKTKSKTVIVTPS